MLCLAMKSSLLLDIFSIRRISSREMAGLCFFSLSPCHTPKMSPPVLDSLSSTCLYLPCGQGGLSYSDTERVTEERMGVITSVLVAACWLDIYMQCLKKRLPRTPKEETIGSLWHTLALGMKESGFIIHRTHYPPIDTHVDIHIYMEQELTSIWKVLVVRILFFWSLYLGT